MTNIQAQILLSNLDSMFPIGTEEREAHRALHEIAHPRYDNLHCTYCKEMHV